MRFGFQRRPSLFHPWATAFVLLAFLLIMPLHAYCQEDVASSQTSAANAKDISMEFLNEGTAPTSIEQLRLMEEQVLKIAEMVKPATVNVAVGESQGTGVVISRDGYILTAAHVISRPGLNARITFPDGQIAFATTLGTHPGIDSGMLKLNKPDKWPYLDLGESDSLKRGQWVIAVGHPGGLDRDRGLVVRVGRLIYKSRSVLRTDCALVGGDSGGPLVDMDGYVIGIHSRIGSNLTDNLHVPIDIFSDEWDLLADDFGVIVGSTTAFLGLSLESDTNRVDRVNPNQPAAKAGIEVGDKIISIDDKKIEKASDLRRALRDKKPRDKIIVKVSRKEKIRQKKPEDSEDKDSEDKDSEDKDSEDKDSEDKDSEDKDSEDKDSEDKDSEDKDSEDKDSEDKDSEDKDSEDKDSEDKDSEDQDSEDQDSEDQDSEDQDSEDQDSEDKDSEDQDSEDQDSEDQDSEDQDSEDQDSEDQDSEDQDSEDQDSEDQDSEDQDSEDQDSEDQDSEDQDSEDQDSEDQDSEDQDSEDQDSEDQDSEDQDSEDQDSEDQDSEDQDSEDQDSEDQDSEDQDSEDQDSEDQDSEDKDSEDKDSEDKDSEDKDSEDKDSEDKDSEDKDSEDKDSEDQDSEDQDSEDQDSEDQDSEDEKKDQTKQVELEIPVTLGYG